jgi:D-glycero-D-manno-heptose 1,7-bisphosphate phosphatase
MTAPRRQSFGIMRGAVFFDRDGTLIHNRHYIKDPKDVELVPHAANAVRFINYSLRAVVVVTNQSGIARGLLTEDDYARVRARLDDLLAERSATIDSTYHCPHHPEFTGPCDCRKPATGMFEQAFRELNLEPTKCAYIGDRWHDIAAAQKFGGRGILVPSPSTPGEEIVHAARELEIAATLTAAVQAISGTPPHGAATTR